MDGLPPLKDFGKERIELMDKHERRTGGHPREMGPIMERIDALNAHVRKLGKADREFEARVAYLMDLCTLTVSQFCRKHHVQNCSECEDTGCGDNLTNSHRSPVDVTVPDAIGVLMRHGAKVYGDGSFVSLEDYLACSTVILMPKEDRG